MATKMRPEATKLYDVDFVGWTEEQATALRAGRADAFDHDNLAEEIETLGKGDRRALRSRLGVLMTHLSKWRHQPERRSGRWEATIRTQRDEIVQLLDDSPSLRRELPRLIRGQYDLARRNAAAETKLPVGDFPERSPFSVDEILAEEWLP